MEPPLPFKVFIRYISSNLPREIQTTIMTREVSDLNELEKILNMFQTIQDREMSRKKSNEGEAITNTLVQNCISGIRHFGWMVG